LAREVSWEPLPEREWQPTIRSLHMWTQIVGKIRLALADPLPHWWHVPLYVSVRGLRTSGIPNGGGLLELEFDFREQLLSLRTSDDDVRSLRLRPMPVADFYAEVLDLLAAAHVDARIWPVPVEVAEAVPFEQDTAPGGYDPEHARALHTALINADRVLTRFRGLYLGKTSPVHFFWGGFDLATTRFSGRPAPRHPGGIPNCPPYVMEEAYSQEVSSAGWWPGAADLGPAFYSYMYPEPPGFAAAPVQPLSSFYHQGLGEFVLLYGDAVASEDPHATVLAFLQATYSAGARLAGWDRGRLERQ
jgi:hypothetical protein